MTVGQRVKQLRLRYGWTQDQLAEKAGLAGHTSVSAIETGATIWADIASVRGLLAAFKMPLGEFFYGVEI